jgi:hypothetical protein
MDGTQGIDDPRVNVVTLGEHVERDGGIQPKHLDAHDTAAKCI